MNRKIFITLFLMTVAVAVFADDAMVLPEGVMRLTFANTYAMADEAYNSDGDAEDSAEYSFYYLGGALEFGITEKVTAAVQWTPGVSLYEDYNDEDTLGSLNDQVEFSGLADLFVGAKVQVVENDNIRFAFAPGIAVPLDSLDGEEAAEDAMNGDDFKLVTASTTEGYGIGGRFYLDYIVTEDFYINFYNQTKYYFSNERYADGAGATYAGTYAGTFDYYYYDLGQTLADSLAAAEAAAEATLVEHEYDYPIYFDFELDFNYDLHLTPKTKFGFGLPVKYSVAGETKEDGVNQEDDYYSVAIDPSVSFFTAESIPFEVAVDYYLTLAGKNVDKRSYVGLQLKLFYDFY
ncbi:MAG: hypothetical protein PQJ59_09215 [Spirochaetales bacterium]|nr:hypothetical protein [Spirochaetales bacterium]